MIIEAEPARWLRTTPDGAVETRQGDVIAYVWADEYKGRVRFILKAYAGKSNKPAAYYNFSTAEKRDAYLARFLAERATRAQAKAERKARLAADRAAINAATDLPVGTVLVHQWGWEQSNVDGYEVVGIVSRTRVLVRPIKVDHVPSAADTLNSMADNCQPVAGAYEGEAITVGVRHGKRIAIPAATSYRTGREASVWDGRPCYRSWYA